MNLPCHSYVAFLNLRNCPLDNKLTAFRTIKFVPTQALDRYDYES